MFAVMPFGLGLGAYSGGVLYDARGTYDVAIICNIILLAGAQLLVWSISNNESHPQGCIS